MRTHSLAERSALTPSSRPVRTIPPRRRGRLLTTTFGAVLVGLLSPVVAAMQPVEEAASPVPEDPEATPEPEKQPETQPQPEKQPETQPEKQPEKQLEEQLEKQPERQPRASRGDRSEVPEITRLRLSEAVALACKRHPLLLSARATTAAATARVGGAKSAYLPRVDTWLQYLRASENGSLASFHGVPGLSRVGGSIRDGVRWNDSFNNFLAALIVQQTIYDFGRTQGAVAAAEAAVKMAEMQEAIVEQWVVFGVIRAFYDLRNARERLKVAEDALVNARAIYDLAEAGVQAGLRPDSERARAEADVAAADVALIRANLDVEVSRARIANALGIAGGRFEPADDAFLPPAPAPELEESIEVALRRRPEVRAFEYALQNNRQRLRSTSAEQYPRINAVAGVNSRGQFLPTAGQDPYQRFNWNVGVVVQIPVFQGMAIRHEKEALRAEARSIESEEQALRVAIVLEVKEAIAVVLAADEAERASTKGVNAAQAALDVSQSRYRAGLANLIELIDAQAAYVAARAENVQVRYERHLARAALSLVMGTIIEEPLSTGSSAGSSLQLELEPEP